MATTPSRAHFQASASSTPGSFISVLRPMPDLEPRDVNLFALLNEPEDASLTGGTRSLDRRLLALNLSGSLAKFGAVSEGTAASRRPDAA